MKRFLMIALTSTLLLSCSGMGNSSKSANYKNNKKTERVTKIESSKKSEKQKAKAIKKEEKAKLKQSSNKR